MSETPTRRLEKRTVDLTTALVLAVAAMAGGGGAGTWATGSTLAGDLREMRAEILGRLTSISEKVDTTQRQLEDHEARLRAIERTPR